MLTQEYTNVSYEICKYICVCISTIYDLLWNEILTPQKSFIAIKLICLESADRTLINSMEPGPCSVAASRSAV
jgi:hypothetical protein